MKVRAKTRRHSPRLVRCGGGEGLLQGFECLSVLLGDDGHRVIGAEVVIRQRIAFVQIRAHDELAAFEPVIKQDGAERARLFGSFPGRRP